MMVVSREMMSWKVREKIRSNQETQGGCEFATLQPQTIRDT